MRLRLSSRLFQRIGFLAALSLAAHLLAAPVQADDRHAGYYYPDPGEPEVYQARSEVLPGADKLRRLGFIAGVTQQAMQRPHPMRFVMFAKGAESEKLLIVALEDGPLDTIYRARAVLANMSSVARLTPLFQELEVVETFTFFDLLYMLGFTQLTISDGREFAHQVLFE
ncbi:MAG: hypothetical protein R3316_11160 [Rhodovibrionaceae bacterium]|nr:hypothetical protein [Rhodovibrionaceae bacterium]